MNSKSKYYEIFGLTPAASNSEVKRAYRKLAMKFHPDRNPDPKAHKLFLDLTEAYQILIDNKPVKETVATNPKQARNERTEEQRVREAQERLRQQQERILRQQNQYFAKLTSGLKWNIFKITVAISTFLAFILIIEPVLPSHFENHVVTGYSGSFKGLQYNDVIYFKTDKNLSLLVSEPYLEAIYLHPEIIVERSFFLRNPVNVWYPTIYSAKKFHVDFSIVNLFPVFPLILLIPFFTLRYKRKSYVFLMFYYFSQYIIGSMTLYILFSQNRWLHLLTLGLVEF